MDFSRLGLARSPHHKNNWQIYKYNDLFFVNFSCKIDSTQPRNKQLGRLVPVVSSHHCHSFRRFKRALLKIIVTLSFASNNPAQWTACRTRIQQPSDVSWQTFCAYLLRWCFVYRSPTKTDQISKLVRLMGEQYNVAAGRYCGPSRMRTLTYWTEVRKNFMFQELTRNVRLVLTNSLEQSSWGTNNRSANQ
jgi:hypothetical protein